MLLKITAVIVFALTALQQNKLIPWNAARKLTWEDFRARPDTASTNAALTSSTINIEFGYDERGLQYTINCNFDKTKSWVRIRNSEVLAHEQGHFDIAEMHARKLFKAMKGYKFNSTTATTDVNRIYETIMKAHHEVQYTYDQETDYSRNKPKQQEWLLKIADDLKSLDKYSAYSTPLAK